MERIEEKKQHSNYQPINRIRMFFTSDCNADCPSCFHKNSHDKQYVDIARAKRLFDYLAEHDFKMLFIQGGEPTLHPEFSELYSYAQNKIEKVILFTNAINDSILKICPRNQDGICYNINLIKENFNFEKLLPQHSFQRGFETIIGFESDLEYLFKKIEMIIHNCERLNLTNKIKFNITLDCMEDIFKNREILNKKFRKVINYFLEKNQEYLAFDHSAPVCFWTNETLSLAKKHKELRRYFLNTCEPYKAGLINANFELCLCNLYPKKICEIFKTEDEDSPIISFHRMNTLLYKAGLEKLLFMLNNELCQSCKYAVSKCRGGCYSNRLPSIEEISY